MDYKSEFERIITRDVKRSGIADLLGWLSRTDFFTAPASTKYHDCFEGGLVLHSLNVYSHLRRLVEFYNMNYDEESIAIVALLHDVCKIGCYKQELRWRKDKNNQWEQYSTYKFEEDFSFGGHGSKSVYLVQNFIGLRPEEATAINCHMGVENGRWEVNEAFRRNPLAFLLHTADMLSTIDYFNNY